MCMMCTQCFLVSKSNLTHTMGPFRMLWVVSSTAKSIGYLAAVSFLLKSAVSFASKSVISYASITEKSAVSLPQNRWLVMPQNRWLVMPQSPKNRRLVMPQNRWLVTPQSPKNRWFSSASPFNNNNKSSYAFLVTYRRRTHWESI